MSFVLPDLLPDGPPASPSLPLTLFNASNNVPGSLGVLEDGTLGQTQGQAYVNTATGDLVLQFQDEELSGIGANLQAPRTYNSLGTMSDGLGADWSFDGEATVMLTGTLNATGSTVTESLAPPIGHSVPHLRFSRSSTRTSRRYSASDTCLYRTPSEGPRRRSALCWKPY